MRLMTTPTLTSAARALLVALAIAAAGPLSPAKAQTFDFAAMTEEQKAAFREAVRAALLEDPQMIEDAQQALEDRRYSESVAALKALGDSGGYVFRTKPEGADLTLIELTDYDCPYCRKAQPEVAEFLQKDGKVEHIVVALPYIRGDITERVVLSAKLQGDQEKVIALHKALMSVNGQLSEDSLRTIVEDAGLDFQKVLDNIGAPEVEAELRQSVAIARGMQIGGTPAFLLGDHLLNGLRESAEFESLAAQIRADRAKN